MQRRQKRSDPSSQSVNLSALSPRSGIVQKNRRGSGVPEKLINGTYLRQRRRVSQMKRDYDCVYRILKTYIVTSRHSGSTNHAKISWKPLISEDID